MSLTLVFESLSRGDWAAQQPDPDFLSSTIYKPIKIVGDCALLSSKPGSCTVEDVQPTVVAGQPELGKTDTDGASGSAMSLDAGTLILSDSG